LAALLPSSLPRKPPPPPHPPKVGLLSAILTHVGADAVVVLGLTDAIFNYMRR
jgi:hypothetical protein